MVEKIFIEQALLWMKAAKQRLEASESLFELKAYSDSINRSYYAIYTAARALLVTKCLESSKHTGTITLINIHFVKKGILEKEMSKILVRAKKAREESDYDFVQFSEEDAALHLGNARKFLKDIEGVLKNLSL